MKKLVGVLSPFQVEQFLYVYEDGNKIDAVESTVDDFVKDSIELIKKHELTEMTIKGPKKYSKMIASKIESSELLKYTTIKINLI